MDMSVRRRWSPESCNKTSCQKQRKTLQQLAESGTLHKNPGRYVGRWVAQSAPARPIGKAPAHLPAAEQAIWAELTKLRNLDYYNGVTGCSWKSAAS
jgi:hypothetical protein